MLCAQEAEGLEERMLRVSFMRPATPSASFSCPPPPQDVRLHDAQHVLQAVVQGARARGRPPGNAPTAHQGPARAWSSACRV